MLLRAQHRDLCLNSNQILLKIANRTCLPIHDTNLSRPYDTKESINNQESRELRDRASESRGSASSAGDLGGPGTVLQADHGKGADDRAGNEDEERPLPRGAVRNERDD